MVISNQKSNYDLTLEHCGLILGAAESLPVGASHAGGHLTP